MDELIKKIRPRSRNFTTYERRLLLSLVKKYANIIVSKRTDTAMIQQKNEKWNKIVTEFNQCVHEQRSLTHLKRCYRSMKLRASKDMSWESSREIGRIIECSKSGKSFEETSNLGEDVTFGSNPSISINNDISTREDPLNFVEETGSDGNEDEWNEDVKFVDTTTISINEIPTRADPPQQQLPLNFVEETISDLNEDPLLDTAEEYHNLRMCMLKKKCDFELALAKEKHELELQFAREKHLKELQLLDLKLALVRKSMF